MSNYHTIKYTSISDGIGVRVAIYLSGCSWHCKGCHNPMTWNIDSGKEFTEDTMEELYNALNKSFINGITLTGGDPLMGYNLQTTNKIIDMVLDKFPNKDIWLYTGFTLNDLVKDNDVLRLNTINKVNVLVDGKFEEDLKDISYPYAGSTNQRIIDIKNGYKDFDMRTYCLESKF